MESKTRDKLIEAAKQVFILKGVEHTTISDIANASDKGRRTIYMYFKNKREIFRAVIERESDNMVLAVRRIVDSEMSPADKLSAYIRAHFDKHHTMAKQNTSLRNLLSMEFLRAERMRRMVAKKEEALLDEILKQGVEGGDFDEAQARRLSQCLYPILRGAEHTLQSHADDIAEQAIEAAVAFLVHGLNYPKRNM